MVTRNTFQKCVYCLLDKLFTGNQKKGCQFSAEHVLNYAFVQGFANNLTLIGKCCHACNQGFNLSGLDATLTRLTPEGFSRFAAGEKNLDRIADFERNNSVTQHYVDDETSPAHEALTLYRPVEGKAPFSLPAQVLILSENGPPDRILWDDFVNGGWQKLKNRSCNLKLIEDSVTPLDVMREFVASKVKSIAENPAVNLGFGETENRQVVYKNSEYERALVKTAFNYFIFASQKDFPDLAYLPLFDPIRAFVKNGVIKENNDFVALKSYPNIDPTKQEKGLKHQISLLTEGTSLDCCIQIYSGITWKICLARESIPVRLNVTHVWDCDSRTIKSIGERE